MFNGRAKTRQMFSFEYQTTEGGLAPTSYTTPKKLPKKWVTGDITVITYNSIYNDRRGLPSQDNVFISPGPFGEVAIQYL